MGMATTAQRRAIKPISARQAKRLLKLGTLKTHLRLLCGNKSELSGEAPDWQSGLMLEPHHICGRVGKHLLNPFEIVMVTRNEHNVLQKHNSFEEKQKLLAIIKILRLKQGFREEE